MKSVRIILLSLGVVAMAAFATGCPGSKEAKKMGKFADKMCDCKDAKCAQDTHKEMMEWIKKHFKGGKKKGTKKNVEKWKKAQQKLNKCYIEKMKAGMKAPPKKDAPKKDEPKKDEAKKDDAKKDDAKKDEKK